MKERLKIVLGAIFFLALIMPVTVFAAITLQPDFKGTVVITSPSGEVQILNAGDAVPAILSGSSIEILEGEITVSADAGDTVTLTSLDHSITIDSGNTVVLSAKDDEGILKPVKGKAGLIGPDGKKVEVPEGEEYHFKKLPQETALPSTEAGDILGTETEGVDSVNSPDSRSIEASPST